MKLFTKTALLFGVLLSATTAFAQMPTDAIYMNAKTVCFAPNYMQSSWTNYWENSLKRENLNMGKVTTQSYGLMVAAGITNRLNIIVNLPYMTTKTSAGNLMGQKGIQDISAWLKYKLITKPSGFSLHGVLGASLPVGNYVPDFLPMSIGLQAKTASGRIIGNYRHAATGLYVTGSAAYILRSKITIDKDAYQAYNAVYNTNQVAVPNATETALRVGYLKNNIQIEGFVERFTCIGGDNIRRNDMPFPTNDMQATTVGAYVKYQPHHVGFNASIRKVIDGLNVGQSTTFGVGILYQIGNGCSDFCTKKSHSSEKVSDKKHDAM